MILLGNLNIIHISTKHRHQPPQSHRRNTAAQPSTCDDGGYTPLWDGGASATIFLKDAHVLWSISNAVDAELLSPHGRTSGGLQTVGLSGANP